MGFLLGWGFWRNRHPAKALAAAAESPLYTGKEPIKKVRLTFPTKNRPGFEQEESQIYATQSLGAQVKQVVLQLFSGPHQAGGASAFPGAWKFREIFVTEQGLAVIDLDPADLSQHPGGTTSEYLSLYTLAKTLTDNFSELKKIQILVGGELKESLAGHLDISQPFLIPKAFKP